MIKLAEVTQTNILLDMNKPLRDFTGVTKFHNAGYYGERVNVASGESWDIENYNPDNLVHDPLNLNNPNCDTTSHGTRTAYTFFQVAPKANLYMMYSVEGKSGLENEFYFVSRGNDVIQKENITCMFTSLLVDNQYGWFNDLSQWMQENPNFKNFWCAGNYDKEDSNLIMSIEEITGVAAYHLINTINGPSPSPAIYSSESENVDFAAPSMVKINFYAKSPSDQGFPVSGTSFSTPWLCGMAALVDDFFIDKTGRPLSRDKMMQFFKDNTVDIGEPGFDVECGYGAVVLPDPSEIDIWKYQDKTEEGDKDMYKDEDKIAEWAKEDVQYCKDNGILIGDDEGNFNPNNNVTRQELACALARLHRDLKK